MVVFVEDFEKRKQKLRIYYGTVSEWLRRWTRNPLGSARVGSNPAGVAYKFVTDLFFKKVALLSAMGHVYICLIVVSALVSKFKRRERFIGSRFYQV